MKRRPLAAFFALTLIVSWGIWFTMAAGAKGWIHLPASARNWQTLGAFGPGICALVVIGVLDGTNGIRRLFERLLIWRVGMIWYAVAFLLPTVISLLATALHMMFGGDAPDFANPPIYQAVLPGIYAEYNGWTILVPVFLQHLVLGSALAEELGWRGFALPRLQQGRSALAASVMMGLVWSLWAAPLYWMLGWIQLDERAFVLLGIIPGQILSTWIFNNTRGSLLLIVLFNNSSKVTDLFLTAAPAHPLITVSSYALVAAGVVILAGPERLSIGPLDEKCRGQD